MSELPVFKDRHTIFHGFGRSAAETAPGVTPYTWWGSESLRMPEGVEEKVVRLQAQDGAHSGGILYRKGGEKTVVVFNHPRGDFANHYLIPSLVAGGYAAFGGQTRYLGNDINLVHEYLCADLAQQIRYLRSEGYEKIVFCGNSGGGPLSTFYQAQAVTPPPGRLTHTAAGDPYDLNVLDLPPFDGLILVAAAVSEGWLSVEYLDPSLTDESDPLSYDPSLDMFNPDNGYRKVPEASSYTKEFFDRYRAEQTARWEWIDAIARADIARRRRYAAKMKEPGYADLPLAEQNYILRMATAQRTLTIYRSMANPSLTDLSINPSARKITGLMHPDPQTANWGFPGYVAVMTPEGWLSTWSGTSTRVNLYRDIRKVNEPVLVIGFDADVCHLPHESKGYYENAATKDKELVFINADHFGFSPQEPLDAAQHETGDVIVKWLSQRFPSRG